MKKPARERVILFTAKNVGKRFKIEDCAKECKLTLREASGMLRGLRGLKIHDDKSCEPEADFNE